MAERDTQVNSEIDYEKSDLKPFAIAVIAVVLLVYLLAAPFVLRILFPRTVMDVDRTLPTAPPPPRLQIDPRRELKDFRAGQDAWLHSYGWVDRSHGVVHIPIDRAMKKVAEGGLDGFAGSSR